MTTRREKKHPCPDCEACQGCAASRCHLCRGQGGEEAERRFAGLSMAEQIALFEAVNRDEAPEGAYPLPGVSSIVLPPTLVPRPARVRDRNDTRLS